MTHPFPWERDPESLWDSSLRRKFPGWKTPAKPGLTTAPPTDTGNLLFPSSRGIMQKNWISGCSAVGSARDLGSRGRAFESLHSDQKPSGVFTSEGFYFVYMPPQIEWNWIYPVEFHFALKYLYIEHFIVLQNISYDFVKEIWNLNVVLNSPF